MHKNSHKIALFLIFFTGSVSVNADAVKTSAGALHTIPVCREQSLKEAKYNQKRAAELLGLTYHQLRALLKKHQMR